MAYSYYGGFTQNTGTGNFSLTGQTIPAGFCVIVVFSEKNTAGSLTVTVGATTLNQDSVAFSSGNYLMGSYSGVVPASSAVTITGTPAFGDCTCGIWTWPGTGTFKSSASVTNNSGSGTLAVTSGDYLFAVQDANVNFSGSTQAPSDAGPGTPYSIAGVDLHVIVADWSVSATNAAFDVVSSQGFGNLFAADYTPSGGGSPKDDIAPRSGAITAITLMRDKLSGLFKPRGLILPGEPEFAF